MCHLNDDTLNWLVEESKNAADEVILHFCNDILWMEWIIKGLSRAEEIQFVWKCSKCLWNKIKMEEMWKEIISF